MKKTKKYFYPTLNSRKGKSSGQPGRKMKKQLWPMFLIFTHIFLPSSTFFEIESLLPENLSYNIGEHNFWPKNFSYANSHEVCPT